MKEKSWKNDLGTLLLNFIFKMLASFDLMEPVDHYMCIDR